MSIIKVKQGLFSPIKTLSAALETANNHDVITMEQGIYAEKIEITKGITIEAEDENREVILTNQIIIDSTEEVHLNNFKIHADNIEQLIYIRRGKLIINNCSISQAKGNSIYVEAAGSLELSNCHVTENDYGIAVYGKADIRDSIVEKTSNKSDQVFAVKTGHLQLSNTKVLNGASIGVAFADQSTGKLNNCHLDNNHGVNLSISTSELVEVANTKIDNSKSNGINIRNAKVQLDYVDFSGNEFPQLAVVDGAQAEANNCRITAGATNAVLVQEKGTLTLTNTHIDQHGAVAIFVKNAQATIEACHLMDSKQNAVYAEDATVNINQVKIKGFEEYQIRSNASHLTITDSEIVDGLHGNVSITRGTAVIKHTDILRATEVNMVIEQKADVTILDSNISESKKNGISAYTKSSLTVKRSRFHKNFYPQIFASEVTKLHIDETDFEDGEGNAISLYGTTDATITNSMISGHLNYPQLFMQENTNLLLQNSRVEKGNSCGIYMKGNAKATIEDTIFSRNNTQVDVDENASAVLRRVEFVDGITNVRGNQNNVNLEDCQFDDEHEDLELRQPQDQQLQERDVHTYTPNTGEEVDFDTVMQELNNYVGLAAVKNHIRKITNKITLIKYKLEQGIASEQPIAPHLVFTGNPGTGKTSIALLIGKLYKSLGLLKKGHVVEANREDLVGPYIGQTEERTKKKIEEALDGVLFIDEAYSLIKNNNTNDFGHEVITTLIPALEKYRGRLSVIIAGYSDEIDEFVKSNPGLPSRFNERLHFENYTPDEMLEIFKRFTKSEAQVLTEDAESLLYDIFVDLYQSQDKYYANARLVRNKSQAITDALSQRIMKIPQEHWTTELVTTITEEDIITVFPGAKRRSAYGVINEEELAKALDELDHLIGLESVKNSIHKLIRHVRYNEAQGEDIRNLVSHTLLLGSPGTGKTIVARILARIYNALGLLKKGHLLEVGRDDFIGPYIGQTEEKTAKVLEKAQGGVLFIDEAYALSKRDSTQDFGKEAIEMLLATMENKRGEFIVIAAGYTNEMIDFLRSNPGLHSRFSNSIMFEDYTPDELLAIFKQLAEQGDYHFETDVLPTVEQYFIDIYRKRDRAFGNARFVRTTFQRISTNCMNRVIDAFEKGEELEKKMITIEDVEKVIGTRKRTKYDMPINEELLEEWLTKLDRLVGLDNVKKDIQDTVDLIRYYKKEGRDFTSLISHTVLVGNPGTGKTEVGRILAGIYEALGILERGDLIEVDRTALVDQFRGGTEAKTRRLIEYAHQCTLFIDEAYTLTNKDSYDPGHTAVEVLLKQMSDKEGQFMVIAAGYKHEMEEFIASNPGLARRFAKQLVFEDYTAPELLEIASLYADDYKISEEAEKRLLHQFKLAYMKRDRTFGNAGFAKTVIENAKRNLDLRMSRLEGISDTVDKKLITEMDLDLS